MKPTKFFVFLFIHLVSIFLVWDIYVADEYWQSLEVAHKLAFNKGILTWEWRQGMHSYIHPGLIAFLYKVLAVLKLDSVISLVLVPRLMQATLSAYVDYSCSRHFEDSFWQYVPIYSWFWIAFGSRALPNTFESSFVALALSWFPWYEVPREHINFVVPAVFSAYMQPATIFSWFVLFWFYMKRHPAAPERRLIRMHYILFTIIISAVMICIDFFFYGSWIFTPFNYFKFHLMGNLSESQPLPKYFYVWHGLWMVLGIFAIPVLIQVWNVTKSHTYTSTMRLPALISIVVTVVIYSFLPRKELHFLLSIFPVCMILVSKISTELNMIYKKSAMVKIFVVLTVGNIVHFIVYIDYYRSGTLNATSILRTEATAHMEAHGLHARIQFLMPCQSMPGYSSIRENAVLKFLNCDPSSKDQNEVTTFFNNPNDWIESKNNFSRPYHMPTHLVMYDSLEPQISNLLYYYEKIDTVLYSDSSIGTHEGRNIVIYKQVIPYRTLALPEPLVAPQINEELRDSFLTYEREIRPRCRNKRESRRNVWRK